MTVELHCLHCDDDLRAQRHAQNAAKGIDGAMWTEHEEVECSECHAQNLIEFVDDDKDTIRVVSARMPTVH